MNDLIEMHENPELTSPVMVVALEGWIDAGLAASGAMSTLLETTGASNIASFDADRILDHRARRPVMHLVNGLVTGMDWPGTELHAGADSSGSDVLMLTGAEPDFEWAGFTSTVMELLEDFECRTLVYLGAYPAPVPHTERCGPRDHHLVGRSVGPAPRICAGITGRTGRNPRGARHRGQPHRRARGRAVGAGASLHILHALPRGEPGSGGGPP